MSDVTRSDDLVPIVALGLLVSLDSGRGVDPLPFGGLALGTILGLAGAALLGRTLRSAAFWSLLFGISLLATGTAERLDLSVLGTGFSLGLALAIASPLRAQARETGGERRGRRDPAGPLPGRDPRRPRDRSGALDRAAPSSSPGSPPALLAAAIVAAVDPRARRGGLGLAIAFLPTGPLGIAIALAVNLRSPGPVGDLVLATALVAAVSGEFLGPPALRRALGRAGELPA